MLPPTRRTFLGHLLAASTLPLTRLVGADPRPANHPLGEFTRAGLPEPVLPAEPGLVKLYWRAWELAWGRIIASPGAPQSPYLDEAAVPTRIWIWDTCFMSLFCRYAPQRFPGIESLHNFYAPLHDRTHSPLRVRHWDNPPLFAWIELEHVRHTGDLARVSWLLEEKQYLQKHYDFFENTPGFAPPGREVVARRDGPGYRWEGNPSGMDNTPRGHDDYASILWVDAIAQQALSARCIAELAGMIGRDDIARDFAARHRVQCETLNRLYWDPVDEFYYDISITKPHAPCRVRTPASYWPMLAGACDAEQAAAMHRHAVDPAWFGGRFPWPSVARNSPYFSSSGYYWRGGIWLPTAYLGIKALEQHGFHASASAQSLDLLRQMLATHETFSPSTIWECYSPTANEPSTKKDNRSLVRRDFCGWSALGPISLFIENVLGFERVDAIRREIHWTSSRTDRHGIRGLRIGDSTADLLAEGRRLTVNATVPFTLFFNQHRFRVAAGENQFTASGAAPTSAGNRPDFAR